MASDRANRLATEIWFDDDGDGRTTVERIAALCDSAFEAVREEERKKYTPAAISYIKQLEGQVADVNIALTAERARSAKLAEALAVAREAMEERRRYAELHVWVKSRYLGEWDMEDRLVKVALAEYHKEEA